MRGIFFYLGVRATIDDAVDILEFSAKLRPFPEIYKIRREKIWVLNSAEINLRNSLLEPFVKLKRGSVNPEAVCSIPV